jgi:hypothetical protein
MEVRMSKKASSFQLAQPPVQNTQSKAMAYAAQLVEKDLAVVSAALKTLHTNSEQKKTMPKS